MHGKSCTIESSSQPVTLTVSGECSVAQQELCMQEIAPNEASVWFQMGKIYKKLEQHNEALKHFNTALDLKPSSSDSNLIKSAIEKIKISDESDDEEI